MRKLLGRWSCALVLAVGFAWSGHIGEADSRIERQVRVLQKNRSGTVILDGNGSLGSGSLIGPRLVLTAAHIFAIDPQSAPTNVRFLDERGETRATIPIATFTLADEGIDLALVMLTEDAPKGAARLKVAEDEPQWGERVFALGAPFAQANCLTEGRYTGTIEQMAAGAVGACIWVFPGNSGGPLVNGDGEIVGVCWGGRMGTNISVYTGLPTIIKFLGLLNVGKN